MSPITHWSQRLSLLAVCAALTACASVTLPAPSASTENVQKLRAAPLAAAKAGSFKLAAGLPADKDRSQGGLRSNSVSAEGGSFAGYLRSTLVAELQAAGLLNESSPIVIEGELTESELDAAVGTGTGSLAAKFVVTRAGKKVYEKTLRVTDKWESSFVGATAIPMAINKYSGFYKGLVGKLIDDAEFRAALAP